MTPILVIIALALVYALFQINRDSMQEAFSKVNSKSKLMKDKIEYQSALLESQAEDIKKQKYNLYCLQKQIKIEAEKLKDLQQKQQMELNIHRDFTIK